jgi:hypothetical protein
MLPLQNRKFMWALLGVCAATAFLVFAYPMYVIRPFRAQEANELALALLVKGWAPGLSTVAAAAAIVCAVLLWRGGRRVRARALGAAAGAATVLFAALTHVNVYERMFHRIDAPESMPAAEARLEQDDMVLAIQVEGQSRAYPIRMMGYHHIVNDWIGATPIVATY